jgi:hypothetical protein
MDQRRRFNLVGGLILLLGLGAALLIYGAAEYASRQALDEDDVYARHYSLAPEHSKKFLHDMEVYGGKANVLMYKFRIWFLDLWQGKSLAYTIAFLSILTAAGVFYVGWIAPPTPPGDDQAPRPGH